MFIYSMTLLLIFFFLNLAFLLSNAGYDVWLGDSRGNSYSQKHKTLSSDDRKYWNFRYIIIIMADSRARNLKHVFFRPKQMNWFWRKVNWDAGVAVMDHFHHYHRLSIDYSNRKWRRILYTKMLRRKRIDFRKNERMRRI